MSEIPVVNTAPPPVRCGMCGGRCRWEPPRWIVCPRCPWSSHSPRYRGLVWRLRVLIGV